MYNKDDPKTKKKKVDERNKAQTNILIIIIILFISCHFPRCLLKFADGYPKDLATRILDMLGKVLLIAYASATPFIYLKQNTRFRKQFYLLFNKICCCRHVSTYETDAFANKSTRSPRTTDISRSNRSGSMV